MYDQIDVLNPHPLRSRRAATALVISIGIHTLIFGILGQQFLLGISKSTPIQSKKITLQLLSAKRTETKPEPAEASISSNSIRREKSAKKRTLTEERKPESNNTAAEPIPSPSVSPQQILTTAKEAALQAAIRHPESDLARPATIESRLADALNPKREPPGVSTRSDGTIRVVTDWGLVYCIRPADEYKISGPEDIPPVSALCR
jgi:hypothetical protein